MARAHAVRRSTTGALLLSMGLLALCSGCIPYTAATTAHPVKEDASPSASTTVYVVPNGLDLLRDSTAFTDAGDQSFVGVDTEVRFRIDESSDAGIRIPSFSGFIANYKRRLVGADTSAFALAGMVGGGFVNVGQHAHVEATVIGSGVEAATVTPYGGLRAMHVLPLSENAVSDTPTLGGFFGLRIGSMKLGLTVEMGVFYDEPALGISSDQNVLFVPSLTLHGRGLLRAFDPPPSSVPF
jgi:hypothetical protein